MWVKVVSGYEAQGEATGAPLVLKVLKSIYGLNQGPENWRGIVDPFLVKTGSKALKSDACVYISSTRRPRQRRHSPPTTTTR